MHHAWLFCGPRGIGKATLAYRLAAHLLSGGTGAAGLPVDKESRAARWIGSQSHPDLFVLERAIDPRTKKLKSAIAVDSTRDLLQFFGMTAGASRWRIAIVDTADDLNAESANTLLKIMEEPPPNTLLVLLSSRPGALLRTVRSRCSRLDLSPLGEAETRQVLNRLEGLHGQADGEHLETAIRFSQGSPGVASELLTSAGAKAFAALLAAPALSPQVLVEIGSRFTSRNASVDEYEVFCSLLHAWLAGQARQTALNEGRAALASVVSELETLEGTTLAFNLDRRQSVIKALMLVDRAHKAV
jgi:DNA polymerase-3 subunit delta'